MDRPSRIVLAGLVLFVTATIGCSSSTGAPTMSGTGSITVTITAADGTTPAVVVSGPNAYNKVIATTQTLSALPAGNYTIVADSAIGPDSVVGTITDTGHVTGSPVAVTMGSNAAVTVTYATKDRVGGLWVANAWYGTLPYLASIQLRESGTLVAAETLATPVGGPSGLALDASGNMWESTFTGDTLLMYSIAARNAGGGAPPTTAITSSALQNADDIAFDPHGNLWVTNCGKPWGTGTIPAVLEFSAAQLAAGGSSLTPAATIKTAALSCPYGIAFDSNGNVWIADFSGPHIWQYTAAQLAVSGTSTPTPAITISNTGTLTHTSALAFDAGGNLWVGNDTLVVVEYTPAMIAASGAPAPKAIIAVPAGAEINGLAFDNRGTLWVTDYNFGYMYAYTSNQLVTGGGGPAITFKYALAGIVYPQQPLFDKFATAPAPSAARLRAGPIAPAGAVHHLKVHRRSLAND